ncbi:MAG: NUDIX domain-containing protein [Clostridia bacterium]|nr:NUDIX domain-containing protein [Clostridia bacterium]
MEKIGYIGKNNLTLTNGLNSIDRLKNIEIQYGNRNMVEERSDFVQPICAGVIITNENQILIVNKNIKSTGVKSPEKDKTLLYIGGHLDELDFSNNNYETFINGMKREIFEELGLEIDNAKIKQPILTYTPTTEKSAKHLGIIFPIVIDAPFETTFTDGKCKFVKIDDLNKIENFESWSQIILKELFQKSHSTPNFTQD